MDGVRYWLSWLHESKLNKTSASCGLFHSYFLLTKIIHFLWDFSLCCSWDRCKPENYDESSLCKRLHNKCKWKLKINPSSLFVCCLLSIKAFMHITRTQNPYGPTIMLSSRKQNHCICVWWKIEIGKVKKSFSSSYALKIGSEWTM